MSRVQRNRERFPDDFMFQLTKVELEDWRSQIAISNPALKMGLRRRPYAFTEHGALMLASVLRSPTAMRVSVQVVRAFVRLREFLATHKELAKKLEDLEKKVSRHDKKITAVFEAIKKLLDPGAPPKRQQIGFQAGKGRDS